METNIIVGLGEALWDVLPEGKKLGGAPANFAYHTRQFGLNSMAVSAVGEDKLGDETLAALDEKGLEYHIARVPYPTGTVQVTLDEGGIPTYNIRENVAWDNIPFTPELEEIARRCRAVCWGSLAQRNVVSRETIHKFLETMPDGGGRLKIFDVNLRPPFIDPDVIRRSLYLCNILKLNTDELDTLVPLIGLPDGSDEAQCRRLMQRFDISYVVLTQGEEGSSIFAPDESSTLPASPVKVVDTVGAGDAFTATFAVGLLSGLPLTEAHLRASDISAYVCTQHGATPPHPREFSFEE